MGVGHAADIIEDARHVPVSIGVVGLLAEHALECCQSEFVFA